VGEIGDAGDEGPAGQTEQAFAGYWHYTLAVKDADDHNVDIGSDLNRTCFLSGVGGNLRHGPNATVDLGVRRVQGSNWFSPGHWIFDVEPFAPQRLAATALCVPTETNRTSNTHWTNGMGAQIVAPATEHRVCFLTRLANDFQHQTSWGSDSDFVRVYKFEGNWWIFGSSAPASAACVDVSSDLGEWHFTAGDDTKVDTVISSTGGVQCALSGLSGKFRNDVWGDGVWVSHDSPSSTWTMVTKNRKGGWVRCFK
jgi:hypothetical protein